MSKIRVNPVSRALTAAELAEQRAMASEPASVPAPPKAPVQYSRLQFSPEEMHTAHRCAGGDIAAIPGELCRGIEAKHQALSGVADATYNAIVAQMEEGAKLLDSARHKIEAEFARFNNLRDALEQRGNGRHQLRQLKQELEAVTAKLNDPSCCTLEDGALLKLEKRRQFLPAEIAAVENIIKEHSNRIATLKAGFNVPALISRMDEETRMAGGGYLADRIHVHQGIERGDIADD